MLDSLSTLAWMAGITNRLKLGTSVTVLPGRNPLLLAKQLATIDRLSGGRMLPAVGLGREDPKELEALGVAKHLRGRLMDETLLLVKRFLAEDHVTHDGEFYHVSDLSLRPKPAQKKMSLWVGGRGEAALRRTGRLGDGWLPAYVSPAEVADGRERIAEYSSRAGRQIDSGHFGVIISYHLEKDVGPEYLEAVRARRPNLSLEEYTALGGTEVLTRLMERYIEAGASKFVLYPLAEPRDWSRELGLLSEEILTVMQN